MIKIKHIRLKVEDVAAYLLLSHNRKYDGTIDNKVIEIIFKNSIHTPPLPIVFSSSEEAESFIDLMDAIFLRKLDKGVEKQ